MVLNEIGAGRWLTPDLLGGDITNPQSLNRYAYALNNPATLTDPLGLDPSGCTSQIDENGNPYVSCSGPDTVTVNGGEPPSLGLIMCELGFGGCGQTTITGPVTGYGQSGGGGGGGGAPAPKPAPPGLQVSTLKLIQSFNQCAANFADKYSVASILHVNKVPVLGALLGSTTAAGSHVLFGTKPSEYVPSGANLAAGVKAGFILRAGSAQAGTIPIDQGFQSIFTTIAPTTLGQTAAGRVLLNGVKGLGDLLDVALPAQVGIDEIEYGVGEAACTAQALGGG